MLVMKIRTRLLNHQRKAHAFSLVEIMVSLAVLTILLLISAQVIGQIQSSWSASNARVSQFKEARTAFDILSRNLGQATLNTYIDYDYNYLSAAGGASAAAAAPNKYERNSDLHFRCGLTSDLIPAAGGSTITPGHAVFFQAPLGISNDPTLVGLDRLLCARGYFVQFSSDSAWVPDFIPSNDFKYRYRLMEYSPPAERNSIYAAAHANDGTIASTWFANAGATATGSGAGVVPITRPVADNIVALILSPRRETANDSEAEEAASTRIAPGYKYDSSSVGDTQHLLPPLVRVVLIAIDEKSAERLEQLSGNNSNPPLGGLVNSKLVTPELLNKEVDAIVQELQLQKLNYRVFSATVALRGAKWSTSS